MTPPDILRPRDVAKQRELVINQNGRSEAVSGRLRRSAVWGASIWGTEGPEFKSRQPDRSKPRLKRLDGADLTVADCEGAGFARMITDDLTSRPVDFDPERAGVAIT